MLEVNKSIKELNLSRNNEILGKGLILIFYALERNNRSLEIIHLNDALCYDEILISLGSMLTTNKAIKEIWMLDCEIEKYLREKKFGIIPEDE